MRDLKLRKDITGKVALGSFEQNQPERIWLTQNQPSVQEELRKKGFDSKQISEELPKYEIYVPSILVPVRDPIPMKSLKPPKEVSKVVDEPVSETKPPDSDSAPAPVSEAAPVSEETTGNVEPSEAEELPLDGDEGAIVPSPEAIKEMSREDLEALAERFDLLSKIKGTGSNGYRKSTDFKKFLIPWAHEKLKE